MFLRVAAIRFLPLASGCDVVARTSSSFIQVERGGLESWFYFY